jgi:PAS domain S-box-containing protein/diguanylate cyclase (GGDEF)-like protein
MAVDNPETFRTVVEALPSGIYIVDRERRIVFWNEGAERISGHLRHEVLGRLCRDGILGHCDHSGATLCQDACPLEDAMRDGHECDATLFLRHKAGHLVPVRLQAIPLRDPKGAVVGAVEVFEQQGETASSTRHRWSLAVHGCLDTVTGLPNVRFTEFQLQEEVAKLNRLGLGFGVLRIRVEAMEDIAAKQGREAVHAVMREVARGLEHVASDEAMVGLWGVGEFLVLLPEVNVHELSGFAGEMQRIISHSEVRWWGDALPLHVRIGGAIAHPWETAEALMERARPGCDSAGHPPAKDCPLLGGPGE